MSKSDAEALVNPLQEHGEMAMQTLALDRCYEREMPVSSLMVDRMMRSIKNKEHLKGVLYYLYKYDYALLIRFTLLVHFYVPKID